MSTLPYRLLFKPGAIIILAVQKSASIPIGALPSLTPVEALATWWRLNRITFRVLVVAILPVSASASVSERPANSDEGRGRGGEKGKEEKNNINNSARNCRISTHQRVHGPSSVFDCHTPCSCGKVWTRGRRIIIQEETYSTLMMKNWIRVKESLSIIHHRQVRQGAYKCAVCACARLWLAGDRPGAYEATSKAWLENVVEKNNKIILKG